MTGSAAALLVEKVLGQGFTATMEETANASRWKKPQNDVSHELASVADYRVLVDSLKVVSESRRAPVSNVAAEEFRKSVFSSTRVARISKEQATRGRLMSGLRGPPEVGIVTTAPACRRRNEEFTTKRLLRKMDILPTRFVYADSWSAVLMPAIRSGRAHGDLTQPIWDK